MFSQVIRFKGVYTTTYRNAVKRDKNPVSKLILNTNKRLLLVSKNKNLSQLARDKRSILNKEFRKTIIDNINESDFQWNSIIQFDKNIPSDLKKKVEIAIKRAQ